MNHIIIFAAFLFYALSASAGDKIIGGTIVVMPDPIAKASVRIHGQIARASFTCSGVLIEQDVVLTAAHCLGPGWAVIEIYFADNSGPITLISQAWSDKYTPLSPNGTPRHDVAILRMKKPAPAQFVPVPLADATDVFANGTNVIIAGYGQTSLNPEDKTGIGTLRKIERKVLNSSLNESEFLVDIKGGGPCFGDSGGPAFIQTPAGLKVAGITSHLSLNDTSPKDSKIYECTNDMIFSNPQSDLAWIKTQLLP
jgi:hypothetical protein